MTPRRKGIVVTELPYLVGPEKIIEQINSGWMINRTPSSYAY